MSLRERNTPPDYVFLSLTGVLVLFGLIVLSSASSVISYEKFGSSFYLVRHQILSGLLPGLILFFAMLRIPFVKWRKLALPFFAASVILLMLVVIPGIGVKLGGSRSWFSFGAFTFQPSEIVKLSLIIYLALWLESRRDRIRDFKTGFIPFAGIVGIIAALILAQPDVGTLSIIAATVLFLAFIGNVRLSHLVGSLAIAMVILFIMIKIAPYRTARLTAFAHPELDPQGAGYQINQALLAVGSGGFFGVGFGHSRQKFRYLPEVTGDSIFPIIAEELGFFITAGFILLIAATLWRMFRIARDAPDSFSRYTVVGIAAWLGIQSFVNIGAMLGIVPLTGLPLPFVSYGGTALAVELAAAGVVGSISRYAK